MKKLFILFLVACVSISAKSQDQKGLIAENFNSNKLNWPIYADESVVWKVENGMYIRQNLKNLCYSTLKPVELDPEGDYWAYLNTKHLDGVTNQAYGISFGALDANNEFAFVITSTGHYEIYKRENDKLTELVKWTETDAINKYESTGNSLYFIKTGKDWNFKINGKFVYSMPAQPLMGYKFGVTSCGIQTVGFDELNVNQVLEHSTPPLQTIVKDTVLFKDDFSNNNNRWAEYDEDGNSAHVKDGKYRVDHNISDVDFSFKTVYINEYQDYSVSVKTNLFRKGSSVDYGMCWGFKDVNNYYGFIITADGLYSVYRVQAGKLRDFTNLISNNAIRKDENSINNLLMKQEDKSWIFFINDQQVSPCPHNHFTEITSG